MNLHDIQTKVHVAKNKRNDFGGYNYRTAEGILAAIKAALPDGAHIIVSDTMQEVAGQIFVSATATLHLPDGGEHTAQGHAMHPLTKKGMDPSQITGAASSYARKYALAGLVALDDGSADPDAAKDPYQEDEPEPFDPAAFRDHMLAGIAKCNTQAQIEGALRKYDADMKRLADEKPPMANEVQKAAADRMAAVSPDSEAA